VVGLAGDVALEAADDLGLGLALGDAALGVGAAALAVAQADDGDHVQGAVGVSVAVGVESMTVAAAAGDRDRAGAAERGEGAVVAGSFDVLSGGDEQLAGVAGRDAKQLGRARRGGRDERGEVFVERSDLLVELLDASRERAEREPRALGGLSQVGGVRSQAQAEAGLAECRLALRELVAEGVGSGDDHSGAAAASSGLSPTRRCAS
jgi:hypothetical protein